MQKYGYSTTPFTTRRPASLSGITSATNSLTSIAQGYFSNNSIRFTNLKQGHQLRPRIVTPELPPCNCHHFYRHRSVFSNFSRSKRLISFMSCRHASNFQQKIGIREDWCFWNFLPKLHGQILHFGFTDCAKLCRKKILSMKIHMGMGQNPIPLFCSHQNSWDLWMWITH